MPLFDLTQLDSRTDDELVVLARAGQERAFETLVRRHQGSVIKFAAKYLGGSVLEREVAQAVFVEVHRGLGTYVAQGRFVFWLRRIALNQCRMATRSSRVRAQVIEAFTHEPRSAVERPDDWLLQKERRAHVDEAVGGLSEKLREVVLLRYTSGHALEEVAEILELPLGTVKSRLFSAMANLRRALEHVP